MLRVNVYCSLIPSGRFSKINGTSFDGSLAIPYHKSRTPNPKIYVKALNDERGGGTSGFPSRSWEPGLEIEVPFEQRPVRSFNSSLLSSSSSFLWLQSLAKITKIYLI